MKKSLFLIVFFLFCSFGLYAQTNKFKKYPDQNWIIRPQGGLGYTMSQDERGWGVHYGARILFNARRMLMGGTVLVGGEYLIMDALPADISTNPLQDGNAKYLLLAPMLEQNFRLLKKGLSLSAGPGYYIGIQNKRGSNLGFIGNIGWSPLTAWYRIKPFISYRYDIIFDRQNSQRHAISIGLSL